MDRKRIEASEKQGSKLAYTVDLHVVAIRGLRREEHGCVRELHALDVHATRSVLPERARFFNNSVIMVVQQNLFAWTCSSQTFEFNSMHEECVGQDDLVLLA